MSPQRKPGALTLSLALALFVLGGWLLSTTQAPVILLEWVTASEIDTAGFNLYRSEQRDGPFARINQELIPPSGDPFAGGSFVYTDSQVLAGQTYYYQLEEIELDGTATRQPEIVETRAAQGQTRQLVAYLAIGAGALIALAQAARLASITTRKQHV